MIHVRHHQQHFLRLDHPVVFIPQQVGGTGRDGTGRDRKGQEGTGCPPRQDDRTRGEDSGEEKHTEEY